MDKDRVAGGTRKITGAIKEKVGRATSDRSTEAEGNAEKAVARAQLARSRTPPAN